MSLLRSIHNELCHAIVHDLTSEGDIVLSEAPGVDGQGRYYIRQGADTIYMTPDSFRDLTRAMSMLFEAITPEQAMKTRVGARDYRSSKVRSIAPKTAKPKAKKNRRA